MVRRAVSTSHFSPIINHLHGLPHRPPFVFVRRVLHTAGGTTAECETWFEPDDPIFAGHFPGNPLVPGVLLTEALAQTAGIAGASGGAVGEAPMFLLSGIRAMKFIRAVRPGERVNLLATRLAQMSDLLQFHVVAKVGETVVAEGQIVLNLTQKQP